MNLDVLRRASQIIVLNCDRFSNFVTATLASSESKEDMIQAVLNTVTPIRHSSRVEVRTDRASALKSLADHPNQQLLDNGIHLILGDHGNRNSNCTVDKEMRELEEELRKLEPDGNKITPGQLCIAVTSLNDRVRGHGLSASQLHFSRDQHTGQNLNLEDKTFQEVREARRERQPVAEPGNPRGPKPHKPSTITPGQIVYLKSDGTKHTSRDPLLVTSVKGKTVSAQKMLRAHQGLAKITSPKLHIDERFLAALTSGNFSARKHPNKPGPESSNWRADMRPAPKPPHVWHPVGPQVDYDEIYEEAEPLEEDPPPPQLLYRPPHSPGR